MEAEATKRPTLMAFVMCERVETGQDGIHSIIRLFDKTTLNLAVGGLPDTEELPNEVPQGLAPPFEFTLFTKWGNGVGHFRQWVEVEDPDGDVHSTPEGSFWLQSSASTHHFMTRMVIGIRNEGRYWLRLYLDGEILAEVPWVVELIISRGPN